MATGTKDKHSKSQRDVSLNSGCRTESIYVKLADAEVERHPKDKHSGGFNLRGETRTSSF